MTKNGDFGQNRKNRSTSNACRIAGTHNAFRFFSFKTFIYYSWTKKTSYRMLPLAAILTKNSQVTMANGQKVCCLRLGLNHEIFSSQNHIKILVPIIFGRFPVNKTQNWGFRPFLVIWSKSSLFRLWPLLKPW